MSRRSALVAVAVLLAACNGDNPELSPPPTDLENTQNLVLEGTMSKELDAYELAAELRFSGNSIGEHNRECETYDIHFTTEHIARFTWVRRSFKQRRGVFSREKDGAVRFVVPLDTPTYPSCDWQDVRLRLFLARDGQEVASLGSLDRFTKTNAPSDEVKDVVRLNVAVACGNTSYRRMPDPLMCITPKHGGTVVEDVPIGPHRYRFDMRFARCPDPEEGPEFVDCLREEAAELAEEVRYYPSSTH